MSLQILIKHIESTLTYYNNYHIYFLKQLIKVLNSDITEEELLKKDYTKLKKINTDIIKLLCNDLVDITNPSIDNNIILLQIFYYINNVIIYDSKHNTELLLELYDTILTHKTHIRGTYNMLLKIKYKYSNIINDIFKEVYFIINNNNYINSLHNQNSRMNRRYEQPIDRIFSNSNNLNIKMFNDVKNFKLELFELEKQKEINKEQKYLFELEKQKIEKEKKKIKLIKEKQKMKSKSDDTKPKKKYISKVMKVKVWNKYIGEKKGKSKCLCCQHNKITQMNFECGHVIANANGGQNSLKNLRPICSLCNKSMGVTHMFEFMKNNGFSLQKIET